MGTIFEGLVPHSSPRKGDERGAARIVTRQFLVYCVSPITGLSYEEATAWYEDVDHAFPAHIIPVFPLRGKTWLKNETIIAGSYEGRHPLSTQAGIATRTKLEVMRCDSILANFLGAQSKSIGSCFEIAWAHLLHKPIVVIMEPSNVHQHPILCDSASMIVPTLEQGLDVMKRLISPI